jgi:transposase InsO family protein
MGTAKIFYQVLMNNAYVESFFKTLKYCPKWPAQGFSSSEAVRKWVQQVMSWYNNEHQYSRNRFVTPVGSVTLNLVNLPQFEMNAA